MAPGSQSMEADGNMNFSSTAVYRLAVDPGKHACGCAAFYNDSLIAAAYVRSYIPEAHAPRFAEAWALTAKAVVKWWGDLVPFVPTEVLLEIPIHYPNEQEIDPNDLSPLAGVVTAIAYAFIGTPKIVSYYPPSQWKGQVPKAIMTNRILNKLTEQEKARIVRAGSKDHNTIDAVGIGLYRVGRLHGGK